MINRTSPYGKRAKKRENRNKQRERDIPENFRRFMRNRLKN